jgi:hypothetical protein
VHPSRTESLIRAFGPGPGAVAQPAEGAGVVKSRP